MRHVDMSPKAVEARIRQVAAGLDLRPQARLDAKLDMSPEGIERRIREASRLRILCLQLAVLGRDG